MTELSEADDCCGLGILTIPAWIWMWAAAGTLFFAGKLALLNRLARSASREPIVGRSASHGPKLSVAKEGQLTCARLWGFLLLWPGTDPRPFTRATVSTKSCSRVVPGLLQGILGVVLLWGCARQFSNPLAAGWVGMIGFCLVLHFGIFAMLAAVWRSRGVPVEPIMKAPLVATSLADFWGRRWNRPFNDLAVALVLRPVSRRWGVVAGTAAAFLVSGLAHEVVISLPALAGWGLPTLYFAIQGAAMLAERRWKIRSRVWTLTIVIAPLFWLFHPPFVLRVVVPFFQAIGALPCDRMVPIT